MEPLVPLRAEPSFRKRVLSPLIEIWRSKLYVLVILKILFLLGVYTVMSPFIPTLATNYFAKVHAGFDIECTGLKEGVEPPQACQSAHNDVMAWKSVQEFGSKLVLGFLFLPMLGQWSDCVGRKPFIILAFVMAMLPMIVVNSHLWYGLPFWWYYLASMIGNSCAPYPIIYAYTADAISPENRTVALGLLSSAWGIAFVIGPSFKVINLTSTPIHAAILALLLQVCAILGAIFILPESLSQEKQHGAHEAWNQSTKESSGCVNFVKERARGFWFSLKILFRSELLVRLMICAFVLFLNFEELKDMEMQYLQEVAGFGTDDQALFLFIMGWAYLFQATILLWVFSSFVAMSDKVILLLGMTVFAFDLLKFVVLRSKLLYFVLATIGPTSNLAIPALVALECNSVSSSEQGSVHGAFAMMKGVAKGIGPTIFYVLFVAFRAGDMYFPGAPFLVAFCTMVFGIVVAIGIKAPKSNEVGNDNGLMEPLNDADAQNGVETPAPIQT